MRLLSRKLWVALLSIATLAVLEWLKALTPTSAGAITALATSYMGINAYQHGKEAA